MKSWRGTFSSLLGWSSWRSPVLIETRLSDRKSDTIPTKRLRKEGGGTGNVPLLL